MNCFIVLYRGTMDDLVLRVEADRNAANRVAKEVAAHYENWETGAGESGVRMDDREHHPLVQAACEVHKLDLDTFCCVTVLTVSGGAPKRFRNFE